MEAGGEGGRSSPSGLTRPLGGRSSRRSACLESMGCLLFGSSIEEPVTGVQTWPPVHGGPGMHLEPDRGSPRGAESRAGGRQAPPALQMRVGPAPTPPCAEVPLGLQDARSRGSSCPAVLGPCFHSPSPSGCVSYCPFGAGRDLRGVWAFTWRARLPPGVRSAPGGGGGGEARLSAAANLQRLFLPLVRGRSEGPHVAGAGGGPSRSHGGQEAAGPRSVPSRSGLSGRLLVLRFV